MEESMEHVIVRFPESRIVLIDGEEGGLTNRRIRVNEGKHTFNLAEPKDYTPQWRRPTVTGTNPVKPLEVIFEKIQV
jgi:hypothetical protein